MIYSAYWLYYRLLTKKKAEYKQYKQRVIKKKISSCIWPNTLTIIYNPSIRSVLSRCADRMDLALIIDLYNRLDESSRNSVLDEILLEGACRKSWKQVMWALAHGADPLASTTSPSFYGRGQLFVYVASTGNIKMMRYLCGIAIPPNGQMLGALYHAAYHNHLCMIKWILRHFDINMSEMNYECNVFYCAARQGHLHICKWLVKKYGILELGDPDCSDVLYEACMGGNLRVVKWLRTLKRSSPVSTDSRDWLVERFVSNSVIKDMIEDNRDDLSADVLAYLMKQQI